MPKRRLFWQIYPSYLLLTIAVVALGGWLAAHWFGQFYLRSAREDLEQPARVLADRVSQAGQSVDASKISPLCLALGRATGTRLTVVLPSGQVLCDSQNDPQELAPPAQRPEVRDALEGRQPLPVVRYNEARDERVLSLATPATRDGKLLAVVAASRSLDRIDRALSAVQWRIAAAGLVVVLLAASLSALVLRRIRRPLEEIRQAAERFAGGDLSYRVPLAETQELAGTAEAINRTVEQIQSRFNAMARQHNQQTAVLASMVEGVLAIDNEERLISLNKAAGELLEIDPSQVQSRRLQEVVRNADLRRFVGKALAADQPIDDDILLHGNRERALRARGAALHDERGRAIGAVVVLNDVTEFRRLEKIRRDFVANVSHELKTPVTAIKGFIETVLDGAIHNPIDAERFLRIAAKQTDRLDAIIEDLLSLSKIEQGEEASNIVLQPGSIKPVLEAAVHDCQVKASEQDIRVELQCSDGVVANFNAPLLEQAVANLLENAVKYSEPGSEVRISGAQSNGEVQIEVADRGCGIEAEHLPRIFERFYRVDRARSRRLGGTGLGLAIVKHIVQAHNGRVTVQSVPGRGSTFTIYLPSR